MAGHKPAKPPKPPKPPKKPKKGATHMANTVKAAEHRRMFRDESVTYALLAATDPDRVPLIACLNAKHTIYIQRISIHVTTLAAQTITFRGSVTATFIAGILPASAAVGDTHILLDLEEGLALPAGEGLDVAGAAGVAGVVEVIAYQRLTPGAVLIPSELG